MSSESMPGVSSAISAAILPSAHMYELAGHNARFLAANLGPNSLLSNCTQSISPVVSK